MLYKNEKEKYIILFLECFIKNEEEEYIILFLKYFIKMKRKNI